MAQAIGDFNALNSEGRRVIMIHFKNPRDRADISIDDQPWQPCRHSVGYWWYDWTNYTCGTHQIVARIPTRNGEYLISKRQRCKVI